MLFLVATAAPVLVSKLFSLLSWRSLKRCSDAALCASDRYDNLVASFGDRQVRAVGLSLGFERVFPSFERSFTSPAVDSGAKIRQTKTQVLRTPSWLRRALGALPSSDA